MRRALDVGSHPIKVFCRRFASKSVVQISKFIGLTLSNDSLRSTFGWTEGAQRGVQLTLGVFGGATVAICPLLKRFPTVHKTLQLVLVPAELLQEFAIDLLLVELVGEPLQHQVGLLASVFQIGGVCSVGGVVRLFLRGSFPGDSVAGAVGLGSSARG